MTENEIAQIVYVSYDKILKILGVGLLEKAYSAALAYELRKCGFKVDVEVEQPVMYESVQIAPAYRMDLLIEDKVVVELKSVENLLPVHKAQLLTYLRLSNKRLGLLINFGNSYRIDGFKRIINCATPEDLNKE